MRTAKWAVKGIVDDFTECDCCGRRRLKRTVALMPLSTEGNEDGTVEDVVYYGTSCAATALGWTRGKVAAAASAAQADRDQRDDYARRTISIYAPVEFAPVRDRARVYYGRNPGQRATGSERGGSQAAGRSSRDAGRHDDRATPSGAYRGLPPLRHHLRQRPAHPPRTPSAGGQVKAPGAGHRHRAEQIRGTVLVVAALSAEAARDVAYADDLTREWNNKAWQAAHA
ncbi:hypothetical protein [Streptomyces albogriseolus]|uniref:hypothetical protein n=1 Tax=Streptomyces albogriseolus TaxID=1887 RepID=UPI00380C3572